MNKTVGLLLVTVIALVSCDNYKEVKSGELSHAFILNSSPTFKGYYYKGSDNNYHYFESKWDLQKNRDFKILIDSLTIDNKYKFKLGEKELRIDLFANSNGVFGQNQFYKLYVLEQRE